jgi:acetylornithine deacetylase/succinyl-diaminopimelate desuccinylase-like protein
LILAYPIDWSVVTKEAAELLSRYIQFDTTNPPGREAESIEFLAGILRDRGFSPDVIHAAPGRANLIVRLQAQEEAVEQPCLLYAHADVVPADPPDWSAPPFGGLIKDGFVWGRGALDDKGLGIIFVQALTLLKQFASPLNRAHHPELINAEYVWDEGGIALQQTDGLFYHIATAEKMPLTIKLIAHGTPGHASVPNSDSAQDRLVQVLYRLKRWTPWPRPTAAVIEMLQALAPSRSFPQSVLFAHADKPFLWRLLQHWLEGNPLFVPLIRNTINLTMLNSGQVSNVIPARAEAGLDARLLPGEDPAAFLALLRSVIADPKVSVEVEDLPPAQPSTPSDTRFFQVLAETLQTLGPTGLVTPYLTPGATDSRFFRAAGMKAYGFTPMLLNTAELSRIHGVDERVSLINLRWGIQVVFEQVVFETLQKL